MAKPSKAEDYERWLTWYEVPIENTTDMDTFASFLQARQEREGMPPLTEKQVMALWEQAQSHFDWVEKGFRFTRFDWTWGTQTRVFIKGFPGAWGVPSARSIWEQVFGIPAPF